MKLQKKLAEPEIFTGSMADVTFLLIIYFMVTMAFSATKGLDFTVPKEDTSRSEVKAEESVFIQVKPGGPQGAEGWHYIVDGRPLPISEWDNYLKSKIVPGSNPPEIVKPIILRPDADAPYGGMMEAFDTLRQMKVRLNLGKDLNISLPTQREIENVWGAMGVFAP